MRPATKKDVARLVGLGVESAEVHERRLRAQASGKSSYLLAEYQDTLIGHVVLRWAGSVHGGVRGHLGIVPELRRFRVADSFQRSGFGRQLLELAEGVVAARGYDSLSLCVGIDNAAARRLYETSGYATWGRGFFESSWKSADADGRVVEIAHVVDVMTKSLLASASPEGSNVVGKLAVVGAG